MTELHHSFLLSSASSKLVRLSMTGIAHGNCTFKTEDGRRRAAQILKVFPTGFVKPQLAFTNKLVDYSDSVYMFSEDNRLMQFDEGGGLKEPEKNLPQADGVIMSGNLSDALVGARRVFIPNADCPVAVMVAVASDGFYSVAVCHVGLQTFLHDKTLLDNAHDALVERMDGRSFQLRVVTGFGARQCCYGLREQENVELLFKLSCRFVLGETGVRFGPRLGQLGIDIEHLVVQNIEQLDMYAGVDTLGYCTSCYGFVDKHVMGFGSFFSNVRDEQKTMARNGLLITID